MITISKLAAEKFKEMALKAKNPEVTMLRVSFGGYGWGGPRLQLTLDELKNENDVVIESEGVTIVHDADLGVYLDNTIIDYSNGWLNRGFVIRGSRTSSC